MAPKGEVTYCAVFVRMDVRRACPSVCAEGTLDVIQSVPFGGLLTGFGWGISGSVSSDFWCRVRKKMQQQPLDVASSLNTNPKLTGLMNLLFDQCLSEWDSKPKQHILPLLALKNMFKVVVKVNGKSSLYH